MSLRFYKYQGTGNDFILFDNRNNEYSSLTDEIRNRLCDRRMGIGADGVMLLNQKEGYDFEMKYYNADGREGTMCGNGGRCIVKFAYDLGVIKDSCTFIAVDGEHRAAVRKDGIVSIQMIDVDGVGEFMEDKVLNTGSPHYIKKVKNLQQLDVYNEGRTIRYSPEFVKEGINVNFIEILDNGDVFVRTYERGVEDETYSCGTGVTAAAITMAKENGDHVVSIRTKGGELSVAYTKNQDIYTNVWLTGPAVSVFTGSIDI